MKTISLPIIILGFLLLQTAEGKTIRLTSLGLSPPFRVDEKTSRICLIEFDLEIEDGKDVTGTMTAYNGTPTYNAFGDLEIKSMERKSLNVHLSTSKAVDDETTDKLFPRRAPVNHTLYDVESPELPELHWELALSDEPSIQSRLLLRSTNTEPLEEHTENSDIVKPAPRFAYIVPLWPVNPESAASGDGPIDMDNLFLTSDSFRSTKLDKFSTLLDLDDEFVFVSLKMAGEKVALTDDRNEFTFSRFGDRESGTLMGFSPRNYETKALDVPDLTGQNRKVLQLSFVASPNFRQRKPEPGTEIRLVIHPSRMGIHRLLKLKSGKIQQIIPLVLK